VAAGAASSARGVLTVAEDGLVSVHNGSHWLEQHSPAG
jgi:hypothetical protein